MPGSAPTTPSTGKSKKAAVRNDEVLIEDVIAVLGHILLPSYTVALVTCDVAPAHKLLELAIDIKAQSDELINLMAGII